MVHGITGVIEAMGRDRPYCRDYPDARWRPDPSYVERLNMKITDGATARKFICTFDDGLDPVSFDADLCHSAQHEQAEMYGWRVRMQRAAALSRTDAKGNVRTITEAMRRAEVLALRDHYHGGSADWNLRAGAVPKINPAIEAMARRLGISYEDAAKRTIEDMLDELIGNAG